ncbi:Hpt domain-containing protein [Janthinobacterium sp.]|uniref:Hpt domain-containing protein n=1 Tax=Janthinobacterium sp. TaxID=1871054 RepID=UPI00293D45EA|nr:Hpt domain-containing protein [Janthinobacterium sp.]
MMSASDAGSREPTVFTVDTLILYMGNDQKAQAIVAKIVADAVATAAEPFSRAAAAARAGSYAEAAALLHGLRGSVGTLGTQRFVSAALAVELAMAERRDAQLPALLLCVEEEFELALERAHAWLAVHDARHL